MQQLATVRQNTDTPALAQILDTISATQWNCTTASLTHGIYTACGGTRTAHLFDLATFVEFYVIGTMILDDVVERHTIRMDTPSIHARYGMPRAIIAGTYLIHKGFAIIAPYRLHQIERIDRVYDGWITKDTEFGKSAEACSAALRNLGHSYGAFTALAAELAGADTDTIRVIHDAFCDIGYAREIIEELKDLRGDFHREPAAELQSGEDIFVIVTAQELGIPIDKHRAWHSIENTPAHYHVIRHAHTALDRGIQTLMNAVPSVMQNTTVDAIIRDLQKNVHRYGAHDTPPVPSSPTRTCPPL